jgi:hypothetical protein
MLFFNTVPGFGVGFAPPAEGVTVGAVFDEPLISLGFTFIPLVFAGVFPFAASVVAAGWGCEASIAFNLFLASPANSPFGYFLRYSL